MKERRWFNMDESKLSTNEEKQLIDKLRSCTSEQEITDAISSFGININSEDENANYEKKAYYLNLCSGFDAAFKTPNYALLTPKEKYIYELKVFLEKLWEVSALYAN